MPAPAVPAAAAAQTPLQRARAAEAAAHKRMYHARGPPAKRHRAEPEPSHIAELDAQALEWESVVLDTDEPPPSPLVLQRYLAHSQNQCVHLVHHCATRGWAPPASDDPDLVPLATVDCLNMGKNPKGLQPSLTLSFYPEYFRVHDQPVVHDYSRTNKRLLLAIHWGRLPVRLLNEKQCFYYNGCVMVELRDHRGRRPAPPAGQPNAPPQGQVVISRVLLRPCEDVVIDDLVRMRGRVATAQAPHHQMRLLSMPNLIEAERCLVNGTSSLCLDPSPRVAAAAAAMHYNAHKYDRVIEKLSPLLADSHAEATHRDLKQGGGFGERQASKRPAVMRRPALLRSMADGDRHSEVGGTGSGLPHGAVVLLNQNLYTNRQWARAESSYVPYRSAMPSSDSTGGPVAPADCPTPEEVLSAAEATDKAAGRDPAPQPFRRAMVTAAGPAAGVRHLRQQRYCNREENYFYILDLVQNEGDAGFECVIRCGQTPQLCMEQDAETHSVHMPSIDALYKFARQFARLKQTEGCVCLYDSTKGQGAQ